MKIAIFSDSHDNIPNIKKALGLVSKEGVTLVIHCGDLTSESTLDEITAQKFPGQIHLVYGNADDPDLLKKNRNSFPNVKAHGEIGEIEVDGKKIAFTHFPGKALELAKKSAFDLIFYGHTHKPWEEKIRNCRLVNPGTIAGMFYKATFALYDTKLDKLELKILENL